MKHTNKNDNKLWLNGFAITRPIYLTLGFNDYVKFGDGEKTKERMRKNHKHFFNELHRQVYKKSKKKIPRYIVIERGGKTGGFHSHSLIEIPEHLSTARYENILEQSWLKTKDGVSLDTDSNVYDRKGLDGYNTKQLFPKNTNAEVDFMNCHRTL